ncbi:MAG: hypothetical protein JO250_11660, partial [Armatimonadetes bacterium]|nr:hypothetical protein [Armatimonadota bacterium]
MNRRNNHHDHSGFAAWARRAATVAAVLAAGLGVALGVLAAPLPNSPTTPHVYSWPNFHAGGAIDPTAATTVPYGRLQGTPSALVGIGGNAATPTATEIPSRLLGNYNPAAPPAGFITPGNPASGTAYFPNHFRDGGIPSYLQIVGPFGYTYPTPATDAAASDVQSSPAAVNVTEYPDVAGASYYGITANTDNSGTISPNANTSQPDTVKFGAGTTDVNHLHDIRQVVYFGRVETVPVLADANGVLRAGGVAIPTTANIPVGSAVQVGAIYAMDGFTGGIIWRYQTPSFSATSKIGTVSTFTAGLSGAVQPATVNGAQPFQIGPVANSGTPLQEGSTALAGTPGTLNVTAGNLTLPANPLHFSLYATGATQSVGNAVTYTGTFRIYQGTSADDGQILQHGTFTLTTPDYTISPATVTGLFTADPVSPTNPAAAFYSASPAQFTGTLNNGTLSGTLQTVPAGQQYQDASVFTTPAVARINVIQSDGTTAIKTVVIAADNNGYVYCLDAVGNGDGSSNSNIYVTGTDPPQIAYDPATSRALGLPNDPSGKPAHVGTTTAYWVYRPDPSKPVLQTGETAADPNRDLPVPQAFDLASPTVYTDANNNGTVYIGNSNGVLYALNATGVAATADPFNTPLTGIPGVPDATPTPQPLWWFSVGGTTGGDSIDSAPALFVDPTTGKPTVYIGTSSSTGTSAGRVYAVDGVTGPLGNGGNGGATPGSANYNVNPRALWAFPDAYGNDNAAKNFGGAGYTSHSSNGQVRLALGDISGSPV